MLRRRALVEAAGGALAWRRGGHRPQCAWRGHPRPTTARWREPPVRCLPRRAPASARRPAAPHLAARRLKHDSGGARPRQQCGGDRRRPGPRRGRRSPTVEADELLDLAARLEGHPDNVAAALYGGFTLAVPDDADRLTLRRFRVPEAWIPVAFIPQRESRDTRDAGGPAGDRAPRSSRSPGRAKRTACDGDHHLGRRAAPQRDGRRAPPAASAPPPAWQRASSSISPTSVARPAPASREPGRRSSRSVTQPTTAHAVEKAWNASGVAGMATRLRFDTGRRTHPGAD